MSTADWILFENYYIVQMYRWSNTDGHSYVTAICKDEVEAHLCGLLEVSNRGGKYEYKIHKQHLFKNEDSFLEKELVKEGYDLIAAKQLILECIKSGVNTIEHGSVTGFFKGIMKK